MTSNISVNADVRERAFVQQRANQQRRHRSEPPPLAAAFPPTLASSHVKYEMHDPIEFTRSTCHTSCSRERVHHRGSQNSTGEKIGL